MKNNFLLFYLLMIPSLMSCSSSFGENVSQSSVVSKCSNEAQKPLLLQSADQLSMNLANNQRARFILLVKSDHVLKVRQLLEDSGVNSVEELGDVTTLLVVASLDQLKSAIDSCGLVSVSLDRPNLTQ